MRPSVCGAGIYRSVGQLASAQPALTFATFLERTLGAATVSTRSGPIRARHCLTSPDDVDGMTPPANSEPSLIGAIIADRYRILSHVGEGGMGQVYLAEHVLMKRRSAIKVMRPALVGDAEALQRFTREAENASKLSHPNVASIFVRRPAAYGD